MRNDERGFTLIELLVVMSLMALVMTLGAGAARNYWLKQSLYGAQDTLVTQLRQVQTRVVAESDPLVYGVRFKTGSDNFWVVAYDPRTSTCTVEPPRLLPTGVQIVSADFADVAGATDGCRTQLSGATLDEFAMFFARGTATQGTLTLAHGSREETLSISVSPIAGRVTKL